MVRLDTVGAVSPAHAGMIPFLPPGGLRPSREPRACGDDPNSITNGKDKVHVSPAHAGMIPAQGGSGQCGSYSGLAGFLPASPCARADGLPCVYVFLAPALSATPVEPNNYVWLWELVAAECSYFHADISRKIASRVVDRSHDNIPYVIVKMFKEVTPPAAPNC